MFKIAQMQRATVDGFVNTVHWTTSQTDGKFSAGAYGSVGFTQTDGMNLIPYADLTEAVVIEWVKNFMGEEAVAALEASLANQIAEQKAPKVAAGVPWGNA